MFPVLSADAISSGDDEDDTERSDDVGADGEQMREYWDWEPVVTVEYTFISNGF